MVNLPVQNIQICLVTAIKPQFVVTLMGLTKLCQKGGYKYDS